MTSPRFLLVLSGLLLVPPVPHAGAAPRDDFGWPLPGTPTVERPFDPPATDYGAGHRGVDLAAELADPVLAAGGGTVTYAGRLAGRGVVTVTHAGGLRTTYEPVTPTVTVGESVARGQVLGEVATGHAACRRPTCLHWGLRRGGTYLDPLALVDPGPVRLLPVRAMPAPGAALRQTPTAADQARRAPPARRAEPRGVPPAKAPSGSPLPAGPLLLGTVLLGALVRTAWPQDPRRPRRRQDAA